ncbi:hypothetical protein LINPERPRIM_LOCUS13297, partial [Linum perenne]
QISCRVVSRSARIYAAYSCVSLFGELRTWTRDVIALLAADSVCVRSFSDVNLHSVLPHEYHPEELIRTMALLGHENR